MQEILGKCYYFEQLRLDAYDAQENCGQKFPNASGKLFEPKTLEENKQVYNTFKIMFGESYIRIGINDKSTEGQFTYSSDGQAIAIAPWFTYQPDGGEKQNCVTFGNYGTPTWIDYFCAGRLFSICEAQASTSHHY